MSQVQVRARPIIEHLADGSWPELDPEKRRILAAWVTLFVMTIEFRDPPTIATSKAARMTFRRTLQPPRDWIIVAGLCSAPGLSGTFWHRGAALYYEPAVAIPKACNTQTTFSVGRAAFHALSAPPDSLLDAATYAGNLGLRLIWPILSPPPERPLVFTEAGLGRAAAFFSDSLRIPEARVSAR